MPQLGSTQKGLITLIDAIDAGHYGRQFRTIEYLGATMVLPEGIYDLNGLRHALTTPTGQPLELSYAVRALIRQDMLEALKTISLRSYTRHTRDYDFLKQVITVRTHKRAHRHKITLLYPSQHYIRFVQKGPKWPHEEQPTSPDPMEQSS